MQYFNWTVIKDLNADVEALGINHNGITGYIIPKRIFRYVNRINAFGKDDRSYKISVYLRLSGRSDTLLGETLFVVKDINLTSMVKSHLFEIIRLAEKAIEDQPFRTIDLSI
jgi:hypothetical protein